MCSSDLCGGGGARSDLIACDIKVKWLVFQASFKKIILRPLFSHVKRRRDELASFPQSGSLYHLPLTPYLHCQIDFVPWWKMCCGRFCLWVSIPLSYPLYIPLTIYSRLLHSFLFLLTSCLVFYSRNMYSNIKYRDGDEGICSLGWECFASNGVFVIDRVESNGWDKTNGRSYLPCVNTTQYCVNAK